MQVDNRDNIKNAFTHVIDVDGELQSSTGNDYGLNYSDEGRGGWDQIGNAAQ